MRETTMINHDEYQKRIKKLTDAELRYTIADCKQAIQSMPNGHKAGYYMDEVHYCFQELNTRKNA